VVTGAWSSEEANPWLLAFCTAPRQDVGHEVAPQPLPATVRHNSSSLLAITVPLAASKMEDGRSDFVELCVAQEALLLDRALLDL